MADGFAPTPDPPLESARETTGANSAHLHAQRLGKERWYDHYQVRVARVERDYAGPEGR